MDHFTLDATHTEQTTNSSSWGDQSSTADGYDTGQDNGPGTWSDQQTVTLHEEGTAGNFTFWATGSSSSDSHFHDDGSLNFTDVPGFTQNLTRDTVGHDTSSMSEAGTVVGGQVSFTSFQHDATGSVTTTQHQTINSPDSSFVSDETTVATSAIHETGSGLTGTYTEDDGTTDDYTAETTFANGDPPQGDSSNTSTPFHAEGQFNLLDGLPDGSGSATPPVQPPAENGGIGGAGWQPGWTGQGIPPTLLVALSPPLPDIPPIPVPPLLKPYIKYNQAVLDNGNKAMDKLGGLTLERDIKEEIQGHNNNVDRGSYKKESNLLLVAFGIDFKRQDDKITNALKEEAGYQDVTIKHMTYVEYTVVGGTRVPRSGRVSVALRAMAEITATKDGKTIKMVEPVSTGVQKFITIPELQNTNLTQGKYPASWADFPLRN
jgi:hypothetical protein